MLFFASCKVFDKDQEAIVLVQQSKYEYDNPLEIFMFGFNGVNATNLDYANIVAQKDKGVQYYWEAEKKGDNIYLVSFMDKKKNGQHWEADLKNKIVKYINNDKSLSKKYLKN